MAYSTPITKSTGDLVTASNWNTNTSDNVIAMRPSALVWWVDGGGAVIATGDTELWLEAPGAGSIVRSTIFLDTAATFTADIWKDTYANFPPTVADTITGGNEPGTSASRKDQDSTLTSWTVAFSDGDGFNLNIDANDNATKVMLSLKYLKA